MPEHEVNILIILIQQVKDDRVVQATASASIIRKILSVDLALG